jgi:TonB-linked SusC/RagA family outer membrane protein
MKNKSINLKAQLFYALLKKIPIAMRITLLLLFVLAFQLQAEQIYSQDTKISLDMKNASIEKVLQAIEEKSDYYFLYNSKLIDVDRTVSVRVKNAAISAVLDELFKSENVEFEVQGSQIILSPKEMYSQITAVAEAVQQQKKTISGTVIDAAGQPIIGANIIEVGTTNGTVTDMDGNFSLSVEPDATIRISYIGYLEQNINTAGQSAFNITLLEDTQALEEVVVVGYGTRRAGELTTSISTIQASTIQQMPIVEASEALRAASGVTILKSNTPGDGASVRIRGLGTINDNNPLWVIDGVPGGSVSPNNIESITVLKDAASQAIYGARAANGVILVTTKTGRLNQKVQVNVSVKSGISQNSNYYDLLNTREYGELLWLEAKNDGVPPNHPLYGDGPTPDIPEYIFPPRGQNVDHSLYDDKMIHEDGDDTYLIMKANKEGTDWLREISHNAPYTDISLDLSGGGQSTSYAFQLGYLSEEGILKFTGFDRYNLRSNVTSKPFKWLEIGERLGVTYTQRQGFRDNNSESSAISWAYRMQPIVPVYDIAGNYAGTRAPGTGNGRNPLFLLDTNQNDKDKRMNISGNAYVKLTPIEGLSFQSLFGIDYTPRHYRNIDYVEKAYSERGTYDNLSEETSFGMLWNWTNTVEYRRLFNNAHDFTFLVGTEAIDYSYNFVNASRSDFFSKAENYIQLATGLQGINNNGNANSWALFSMFGRVNYNYENKYMFEGVVRRDGSSRFGKEHRYGTFPAFSAAWRISNEEFMKSTSGWLSDLKLRFGYGITGNDRVGDYNSYTNFTINYFDSFYPIKGDNVTTGSMGFYQSTLGNPDVKWETTATTNLGVDIAFSNNLTTSIDLWNRKTSDMLYPQQIPMILGRVGAPSINVGEMKNVGFDIELGYMGNTLNRDLTYNINLNVSHYKNEIVKLSSKETEFLPGDDYREITYTRSEKGTSFPEFYGYEVEGIFQTQAEVDAWPTFGDYNQVGRYKYKDVNEDGVINSEDRTYIGSPHPLFTSSLSAGVDYKGFGVFAQFYTSYGNEMVNYVRRWIDFKQFNGGRSHDRLYNSWGSPYLSDNTKAKLPKAESNDVQSQLPSTAFVEDASYLRLENLRVHYDLNRILKSEYFREFQIFGQMSNVFTITSYSGLDPEVNTSGKNLGVDQGAWPTPRQIMFGINIGL